MYPYGRTDDDRESVWRSLKGSRLELDLDIGKRNSLMKQEEDALKKNIVSSFFCVLTKEY